MEYESIQCSINGKSVEAIIDRDSEINIITKEIADKLGLKINKDTCFSEVNNKRFAGIELEMYNIKNRLYTICKRLDIPINIAIIPEQGHNSVREFYKQLKNYALVKDIHDEDTINLFFIRGLNKKFQSVAFAEPFAQKHMPLDEWVTKLTGIEKICQLLSHKLSD
ncbi:12942_t:CDS:1 [Acaulospora colombiana]|uniref:12942_t:CDS:1 n=1 Tax=Acaulospora colombiana TaxID=27376 RepID=A0ACA9KH57_9GLOM|nr:12942_t:CDS:1 [Acaulospora colombiana]